MKKYPYREWMWTRDWTPEVSQWFRNNVPTEDYRRYKDPLDYGTDTPELEFEFVREEDALAFRLKFR